MNRTIRMVIGVAALVLVAGASFYGGVLNGRSQVVASSPAGIVPGAGMPPGAPGAGDTALPGAPGNMTVGEIAQIDGDTLVITDASGNQVRVLVTKTTLFEKNASVTVADLAAGDTVSVSGSQNEDGSISARSVQVGMPGRFAGGQPAGPTSTTTP